MKKLMIVGLLLLNYTICLKAPGRNSTDAGGSHNHHSSSSSSSSYTPQHPTSYQAPSNPPAPSRVANNENQARSIGTKENNDDKCCTVS